MTQANVMTEEDDADTAPAVDLPGADPAPALAPLPQPAIHQREKAPAEQFIPVEVGDEDAPLPADAPLTEDQGDQPLVRPAQPQQPVSRNKLRRDNQKRRAAETSAENIRLRNEVARLTGIVDDIQGRVGKVEPRLAEIDRGALQQRINDIKSRIQGFDAAKKVAQNKIVDALENNDKAALLAAMEERDQAVIDKSRQEVALYEIESRATAPAPRAEPRADGRAPAAPAPRPIPRAVQERIDDFQARHPWYDANGGDKNSQLALFFDAQIANEGFDPSTQEYWDELDDRVRTHMPFLFEDGADPEPVPQPRPAAQPKPAARAPVAPQRRGPMVGGPGEAAPRAVQTQVRITPERKKALIDAGIVAPDGAVVDQKKFNRTLERFAQFDRENQNAA